MRSVPEVQSKYENEPTSVGYVVFAYYFYFSGHTTLERALPGNRKT